MKIDRVPKTETHLENSYQRVDERDLSAETESWTEKKVINKLNISLEGAERKSSVRIVLSEGDVIALFEGLLKGLKDKLSDFENVQKENYELKRKLGEMWKIRMSAVSLLASAKKNNYGKYEVDLINSIISEIDRIQK